MIFKIPKHIFIGFLLALVIASTSFWLIAQATPTGNHWFYVFSQTTTTDAGTNYYYVGQYFTATMRISSTGTSAGNIWLDYPKTTTTASNLSSGSYYSSYPASTNDTTNARIKITGMNSPVSTSTGVGTFATARFTMIHPTNANYGTANPAALTIITSPLGGSDQSNIALNGIDRLDDKEDFSFYIWADTKAPYATSPVPTNGATGILVDANYTFDLRDSKDGYISNAGVGTGLDTSSPARDVLVFSGSATTSRLSNTSASCSGIWGTNLCAMTVNPASPLGISGDQRNWNYNTTYYLTVGGWRDLASSDQDELGDSNGPNTMASTTYSFTTEADTDAPLATAVSPTAGQAGVSVSSDITIDLTDKKSGSSNISGTGVASTTCRIVVESPSFTQTTYQYDSSGVTVSNIDYGYRFVINPTTNFAQNETVTVTVQSCQDLATSPNTMATYVYTFSTADTDPPYVTSTSPSNDEGIAQSGSVRFDLKDDGVGVDLNNTVVYINGDYWTRYGGSGSVTTNGTVISFANSNSFNTRYQPITGGYRFTITPGNLNATDSVPIIIYSRDLSSNLMGYYVYGLMVGSASASSTCSDSSCCASGTTWSGTQCSASGSSFCGTNTTWNGSQCIGSGGGTCGGGGGGGAGYTYCGAGTSWNPTTRLCEASLCTPKTITIEKPVTQFLEKLVYVPQIVEKYLPTPDLGDYYKPTSDTSASGGQGFGSSGKFLIDTVNGYAPKKLQQTTGVRIIDVDPGSKTILIKGIAGSNAQIKLTIE